MMQSDPNRRAKGAAKYAEIMGRPAEDFERNFADAPALGTFILENVFGGVYQDPTLDNRTRMIVNVAALTALGTAQPQLKNYIGGALRCGVSRQELIAIMVQLAGFAGVPAAINGVTACREVFAAQDGAKK
jgi:4-carboxymuconolactone decarboxylase